MESLKDAASVHKDIFAKLLKECEVIGPKGRAYATTPGFFMWVERDANDQIQGHIVDNNDAEAIQLSHIRELYALLPPLAPPANVEDVKNFETRNNVILPLLFKQYLLTISREICFKKKRHEVDLQQHDLDEHIDIQPEWIKKGYSCASEDERGKASNACMYITDGDDDDEDEDAGCYMCNQSVDPSYRLLVKGSGYGYVAQGQNGIPGFGIPSCFTIQPLWKLILGRHV